MNGNGHNHELDDELLSAYVDGELTDSERAAVEARLAKDPDAQHLLHQLRSVSQDVQSLPLKPAPLDLRSQILNRIESAPVARKTTAASEPLREVRTDPAPLTFQGRRPWVWASLAIAAGLMIMFLSRGDVDRENLASVAKSERGRSSEPHDPMLRDFSGKENEQPAAAADRAQIAKSESFDASTPPSEAAPVAMPPSNVALDPAGAVAAAGNRLDQSASRSGGLPGSPKGGAVLSDVPSDESIFSGKLAVGAPSPPPAPASVIAPEMPAAVPASPITVLSSPPQNIGRIAQSEVNGQPMPPGLSTTTEQLAEVSKETKVNGAFSGGGGGFGGQAGEHLLERSGEAPTLVVHVVAKKYALDNKAFEDLLAKNHIQLDSSTTALAFEEARRAGDTAGFALKTAEQSDRFARGATEKPTSGEQLEFVEVEAPQQSIVACLAELKQDSANYAGVAIESTASLSEGKRKADSAPADVKLGTDLSLYARGVVPQSQKDSVTSRFYAFRSSTAAAPELPAKDASAAGMAIVKSRDQDSGRKSEVEDLKAARSPAAGEPMAGQSDADKSTLGRARRIAPAELDQRALGQLSTSGGTQPRGEDTAKQLKAPIELDTLAKQNAGNLRVLFVIGEETPAATSAPASEKSK